MSIKPPLARVFRSGMVAIVLGLSAWGLGTAAVNAMMARDEAAGLQEFKEVNFILWQAEERSVVRRLTKARAEIIRSEEQTFFDANLEEAVRNFVGRHDVAAVRTAAAWCPYCKKQGARIRDRTGLTIPVLDIDFSRDVEVGLVLPDKESPGGVERPTYFVGGIVKAGSEVLFFAELTLTRTLAMPSITIYEAGKPVFYYSGCDSLGYAKGLAGGRYSLGVILGERMRRRLG